MENTLNSKINSYLNSFTKSNPKTAEIFMDLLNDLFNFRLRYFTTKQISLVNIQEKDTLKNIRALNINPIMREIIIKDTYKMAHKHYLENK